MFPFPRKKTVAYSTRAAAPYAPSESPKQRCVPCDKADKQARTGRPFPTSETPLFDATTFATGTDPKDGTSWVGGSLAATLAHLDETYSRLADLASPLTAEVTR